MLHCTGLPIHAFSQPPPLPPTRAVMIAPAFDPPYSPPFLRIDRVPTKGHCLVCPLICSVEEQEEEEEEEEARRTGREFGCYWKFLSLSGAAGVTLTALGSLEA
ncbi:hypothetical protein E2C01_038464 [Portunus trituberculatus]|uniref:Uncharacterized protein n=1 Tax=Portunus trituberculatus TaxID=210409 RepID=A0A5B7FK73_PORTR|nr:hypothetical protein [Portunus trituberculatus]